MNEEGEPSPILTTLKKNRTLLLLAGIGVICLLVGIRIYDYQRIEKTDLVEIIETESTTSAQRTVVVHIAGAVAKPGLYELPHGARIADLIDQSGGIAKNADQNWLNQRLNLAQILNDGAKIYIPAEDEAQVLAVTATTGTAEDEIMSINNASQVQLEALPGIGEVTAQKIIANRPYQSLEELTTKKVVGKSVFEKIKDRISL